MKCLNTGLAFYYIYELNFKKKNRTLLEKSNTTKNTSVTFTKVNGIITVTSHFANISQKAIRQIYETI